MISQNNNLIDDGFTFVDKVFPKKEILDSKNAFWDVINCKYDTGVNPENRFWNLGEDPKKIIKIDKPHLSSKVLYNLITQKTFGQILAKNTNSRKIQVWHSQGVWKPTGGGIKGNAGWHRDIQYWPFWEASGVFTAWIALTDVFSNSGPVRYILGSNHWNEIKGVDFFNNDITSQDKTIQKKHKDYKVVSAEISSGSIAIHGSKTYHSSIKNNSGAPRIGMVVHFATDQAKRINLVGEHSNYLDMLSDQSICPVIYDS
ncbi:MAG: phytanoyl-CoA dioxygenase family protein [Candidatus Neomarinimicrobiota bacterium]